MKELLDIEGYLSSYETKMIVNDREKDIVIFSYLIVLICLLEKENSSISK